MSKVCSKCLATRDQSLFYKDRAAADGLRPFCKACDKLMSSEYKKANSDKVKAYAKQYRVDNKDYFVEKQKEFRRANPEYCVNLRLANLEGYRARDRAQAKKHAARSLARDARKRAARVKATPSWANKYATLGFYRMGKVFGRHVDHIVPLNSPLVCGLHVEHNLQLLDPHENFAKGNRFWPHMF